MFYVLCSKFCFCSKFKFKESIQGGNSSVPSAKWQAKLGNWSPRNIWIAKQKGKWEVKILLDC